MGIGLVRDQAFKTVDFFVKKTRRTRKDDGILFPLGILPLVLTHILQLETVVPDPSTPSGERPASALPNPGGLVNTATGAAGTSAEWAIFSIGLRVSSYMYHQNCIYCSPLVLSLQHLTYELQWPQAQRQAWIKLLQCQADLGGLHLQPPQILENFQINPCPPCQRPHNTTLRISQLQRDEERFTTW